MKKNSNNDSHGAYLMYVHDRLKNSFDIFVTLCVVLMKNHILSRCRRHRFQVEELCDKYK